MINEQEIQDALDNWQDANYICGCKLGVSNSCMGHDVYNLDYHQRQLFIDKLDLISVKLERRNATFLMNKAGITNRIIEILKENIKYRELIFNNKKELQYYFKALSL